MSTSFARRALPASALLTAGAAALALGVTPAAQAEAAYPSASNAVFVQTDNTAGNQVDAYQRAADGTLSLAKTYETGGLGGMLAGTVVDHLASQGSLTYDAAHGLLYAVNAGSNTVSVFAVNGAELSLRQVISSGGTFPVSVAVHGGLVYVLNAQNGGSIQGYLVVAGHLLRVPGWNRQLGLDTSTRSPGQVGFTANGRDVVVTTKTAGNGVDVYRLGWNGTPSQTPTVTSLPGTNPFALQDTGWNQIAVVEAATSTVVNFNVNADGTLTPLSSFADGQAAACWVTGVGNLLFASNAGSANETGIRVGENGSLTGLGNTSTDAGTVDASASPDGRNLYVQSGGTGNVDEYSINADGSLTQIGSVSAPGAGIGSEGIAVG